VKIKREMYDRQKKVDKVNQMGVEVEIGWAGGQMINAQKFTNITIKTSFLKREN